MAEVSSEIGTISLPNGKLMVPVTTTSRKPIHEIRMGRIKAAIWQNETDNGIRYNVTVSRLYKDGNDWKQTESFGRDDLPVLAF